ncbi:hypothetical protein [Actinospica robiniae]|uniref:hypothetical protein n=1 Tax=Actinospica robiniae TaxID=304901 RepID=UPI000428B112|nr:hypothetical protein [Actinospica robiniae]
MFTRRIFTLRRSVAASVLSCLALAAGPLAATAATAATTSDPAAGSSAWKLYDAGVSGPAVLDAVVAPARDDAWAAGFTIDFGNSPSASSDCINVGTLDALMLHWDGNAWHQVTVPDLGRINAMSASSPADVWASADCGLIHWDGTRWTIVSYAVPANSQQPQNGAVVADRPNDAWMAGSTYDAATGDMRAFIDHWNGRRWTRVPTPDLGAQYSLDAVDAQGPDDVWVAGTDYTGDLADSPQPEQLILLHWDGTSWTRTTQPATGDATNRVTGLQIQGQDSVWVVGWGKASDDPDQNRLPLALHWNGHTWTSTAVPAGPGELMGLTTTADQDQWAVGDTYSPAQPTYTMDLLRRTPTGWVNAPVPVSAEGSSLDAAAAIPGGGFWVVGNTAGTPAPSGASTFLPLIARHGL